LLVVVEVLLRSPLQLAREDDTDRRAASEEVSLIFNPIARKKQVTTSFAILLQEEKWG